MKRRYSHVSPELRKRCEYEISVIRHMGFSIHDTPDLIRRIVDEYPFEFVILQYNLLDRSREGLFPYLKDKGVGVMVMGPAAGGRLCVPLKALGARADIRPAEIAFRFVFSNPRVDVAFSGMESMEQIEENARISENAAKMNPAEKKALRAITEKTGKLQEIYCTGCGYCLPCPNEVNIPEIFKYYIWKKVYGLEKDAREAYAAYGAEGFWIPGKKADDCAECGECEGKCPQKIEIMSQLKEAHAALI